VTNSVSEPEPLTAQLQSTPRNNSNNYHHGNLRRSLLDKGLELLESRENAEISLRELAREVGVSTNAAYRHFENKDALMVALAVEGLSNSHA